MAIAKKVRCGEGKKGLKRKCCCIEQEDSSSKKKLDDDYVMGQLLGRGSFGIVRACHDKIKKRLFACKSVAKIAVERIHDEIEIMHHLSGHPGVVTLHSVYEDQDSFHLIMELCDGGCLIDDLKMRAFQSEPEIAAVIKEIVTALKYCHESGVIHGDVKPHNILWTMSGRLKLTDFGNAVRVHKGQQQSAVGGTPCFMAPEVTNGIVTEKSDIWAVGVMLHWFLVNSPPFKGKVPELYNAVRTEEIDFESKSWISVSDNAKDIVRQMLTKDVSQRPSAEQVLNHPWLQAV